MNKFEAVAAIHTRTQRILDGLTVAKISANLYMPSGPVAETAVPSEVRLGQTVLGNFPAGENGAADALVARVESALGPVREALTREAEAEVAALFVPAT